MFSELLLPAAAAAFIVGAFLVVVYGVAAPVRTLLLQRAAGDSTTRDSRAERFDKLRRTIGVIGASLCMVASLALALAFSVRMF
jgi:multisubunit Na+/H+ antiporter MnhG subunit